MTERRLLRLMGVEGPLTKWVWTANLFHLDEVYEPHPLSVVASRIARVARPAVILGATALVAYRRDTRDHGLGWLEWRGGVAFHPHPSGLSRWWNDPRNIERAKEFWDEVLRAS